MEAIKSLLQIITPNKTKYLEVNLKTEDWPGTLYELLTNQENLEDKEAAQLMFGNDANQATYFQITKRKLRDRLINMLFLIVPDANNSNHSDLQFKIQKSTNSNSRHSKIKDFLDLFVSIQD